MGTRRDHGLLMLFSRFSWSGASCDLPATRPPPQHRVRRRAAVKVDKAAFARWLFGQDSMVGKF